MLHLEVILKKKIVL